MDGNPTARIALGAAALLAVAVIGWLLSFLIAPVALALLVFYVLSPIVIRLESSGLSRQIAVACTFLGVLAVIALLALSIWPALHGWLDQVPQTDGGKSVFEIQLANRLSEWEAAGRRVFPRLEWNHLFERVRLVLEHQRKRLMENLPSLVLGALSNVGTFLLIPVIALFLLLDGSAMHKRVISWVPNRYFETTLMLLHRVDRQIASYLRGAAAESSLVAILLSVMLLIAGMPHAVLFGCIYGVANVIPLLGPSLGAGAGLLYGMMDASAPSTSILLACYAATYAIDAGLINPAVLGKALDLHPLAAILGIAIGGAWAGIPGMLVATPLLAIGKAIWVTAAEELQKERARRLA